MKSRKFWLISSVVILSFITPILYKIIGINDSITTTVVGAMIGCSGIYNFANVWSKKQNGNKPSS